MHPKFPAQYDLDTPASPYLFFVLFFTVCNTPTITAY